MKRGRAFFSGVILAVASFAGCHKVPDAPHITLGDDRYRLKLCQCANSDCSQGQIAWITVNYSGPEPVASNQMLTNQGCHPSTDSYPQSFSEALHRSSTGILLSPQASARTADLEPQPADATPVDAVQDLPPAVAPLPFAPLFNNLPSVPIAQPCDPNAGVSVFHTEHVEGRVKRLQTCPESQVARIPVTSNPIAVQVTPDGSLAIVTSYDSAITFIDTATNTVTGVIKTDSSIHPAGLAISPDGTRAYVTNLFDTGSSVLVVDIASRTIVSTISVPIFPYSLAITPDGALVYVTFYQSNTIYVIDTLSNTVAGAFAVPAPAYGIAFNPTGLRAYVATAGAPGQLQVVDTATYRVVAAVTLGNHPNDVKVTPDGSFVFVTNFQSNFVSQVETRTNTLVRNIPVGYPNWGLVLFR